MSSLVVGKGGVRDLQQEAVNNALLLLKLSWPQDLRPTATPTFQGLIVYTVISPSGPLSLNNVYVEDGDLYNNTDGHSVTFDEGKFNTISEKTSTQGIKVTGEKLVPTVHNATDLGTQDEIWENIYGGSLWSQDSIIAQQFFGGGRTGAVIQNDGEITRTSAVTAPNTNAGLTIPDGTYVYRVTQGTATAQFAYTLPANPTDGEDLVIINHGNYKMTNAITDVNTMEVATLVGAGGTWVVTGIK